MSKMIWERTVVDILYTSLFFVLISTWSGAKAAKVQFDLETYLENSDFEALMPRSNANGSTSVLLKVGQYVEISFCLPVEANVTVEDIVYSNDGQSDNVPIFIDDQIVGSFRSKEHSDWGHKWNEFLSTGPIGEPKSLRPGFHKIQISVNETDEHGVELDTIGLNADIPDFDDEEFLRCEKCLEQVVSSDIEEDGNQNPNEENTSAVLVLENQGLVTSEDGTSSIVVDMIPRPMVPCRVLAVTPWYIGGPSDPIPGSSTKGPERINITQIWEIGTLDQSIYEFTGEARESNSNPDDFRVAKFEPNFNGVFDSETDDALRISWSGRRLEELEIKEDDVLFFEISLVAPHAPVTLSVYTSDDLSPLFSKTFTVDSPTQTWEFPATTWSTDPSTSNFIGIIMDSAEPTNIGLDYVQMFLEKESPKVRNTKEFVIEARSNGPSSEHATMIVTGIQNQPVEGAEVVQISVRANGGQDLVPIFQLQQNGGITITSPLLGEFPPADQRSLFKLAPYLSGIKSVSVDPSDLTLNVTFQDDSVVRLRVDATSETAEFTILGADLKTSIDDNPFVSFETPWKSDADNGADTIVTNERNVNQLLTGWDSLEASTVDFVNRCGSADGVTGPDWKIELLE